MLHWCFFTTRVSCTSVIVPTLVSTCVLPYVCLDTVVFIPELTISHEGALSPWWRLFLLQPTWRGRFFSVFPCLLGFSVADSPIPLWWSLKRIQKKCLSVCLSVRMRVTLWSPTDKFISKRLRPCRTHQVEALAEAIVIWPKPHLIGCPVCGVIRVDFQHPKTGWRIELQQSLARGKRQFVSQLCFQVE